MADYVETVTLVDLLPSAKLALRIASTAYDDEITALIAAAKDDLKIAGVSTVALTADAPDPLITRAIITYVKAHFGMDNADADRFMLAYQSLRVHLSLSIEYKQEATA